MNANSIVKYCILLASSSVVSLVHGNDLIDYGKNCLAQEAHLNKAKLRLDKLTQKKELNRSKVSQAQENLEYYQGKLSRLKTSMTDCAETTPNSAYCHQIRRQYSEVTHVIQDKIDTDRFLDADHSNDVYEVTQESVHARHTRFIAQCRDSDTHYAFIQDPEAYSTVCLVGNNKESVTCSLF